MMIWSVTGSLELRFPGILCTNFLLLIVVVWFPNANVGVGRHVKGHGEVDNGTTAQMVWVVPRVVNLEMVAKIYF